VNAQNHPIGPTRRSHVTMLKRFFTAVFLRASQRKRRRFVFDDRLPYEFDGTWRARPGRAAAERPSVRRRRLTGASLAGCRQLTMSLSKIRGVDSRRHPVADRQADETQTPS